MTLKNRFNDFARLHTWTHFVLGSIGFFVLSTAFVFISQRAGERGALLSSAAFSAGILGAGLVLGLVFAGVGRLLRGHEASIQVRESALWIACIFGVICLAVRMFS